MAAQRPYGSLTVLGITNVCSHEQWAALVTGTADQGRATLHRVRARHAPLSLACDIRQGQRPWARSRLLNLSETGFCLVWLPALELDRGMWLKNPDLQLLRANIRWRNGSMVGCEFEQRLHPAVFEHIVRQANSRPGGLAPQLWWG